MEQTFLQRHQSIRDLFGLIVFILFVIVGTALINSFVFRSFNVVGPSMEKTLFTGDRLIVNRMPVTWAQVQNKNYVPERGQIIVFKNPHFDEGMGDEYIVKRVIAFPGERVILENGEYRVINDSHPDGFNPDDDFHGGPGYPTSGSIDTVVPDGELFVSGDHRQANFSYDSRNGLGTIPFYDVIGPVSLRIYPFTAMRSF